MVGEEVVDAVPGHLAGRSSPVQVEHVLARLQQLLPHRRPPLAPGDRGRTGRAVGRRVPGDDRPDTGDLGVTTGFGLVRVRGEQDGPFVRPSERMAETIPGARLEWIEDSYTFVSEDQPERLAKLKAPGELLELLEEKAIPASVVAVVMTAEGGVESPIDADGFLYCVGGRTAVAVTPSDEAHRNERFVQTRVGLHHVCFRARNREDVDEVHRYATGLGAKIVHPPEEGGWAPGRGKDLPDHFRDGGGGPWATYEYKVWCDCECPQGPVPPEK